MNIIKKNLLFVQPISKFSKFLTMLVRIINFKFQITPIDKLWLFKNTLFDNLGYLFCISRILLKSIFLHIYIFQIESFCHLIFFFFFRCFSWLVRGNRHSTKREQLQQNWYRSDYQIERWLGILFIRNVVI